MSKFAIALLTLAGAAFGSCVTDASNPGCVHFEWKTSSISDPYTNAPTTAQQTWLKSHMYRIMWYSGYGDTRIKWFPNSWVYRDSSSIYTADPTETQNPSWVQYDTNCNPLFINWGCSNGTCPQYSPDYASTGFQDWWIQAAQTQLAPGYKGLFIDDVNLPMNLTTGSANATPLDMNTDLPMTQASWELQVAGFMAAIRAALPNAEIVHNAIWFAGNADPTTDTALAQEIAAANYINIERGFADTGLTGDGGFWSIQNLFNYIDKVHALGARFIAQQYGFDGSFSLAAYFLVNNGNDLFSVDAVTPDNWPAQYDVDLGTAKGARYTWNSLIRRDFANGIVLLNPPSAASVTTALPGTYKDVNTGSIETTAILPGRSGAILLAQAAPPPPPPPTQPIADGAHTIKSALSGYVIDDPGYDSTSGVQVLQWSANGGTNQSWIFTYNATAKTYTIQNQASQLYLADASGKLEQINKSTATTQQWTAIPVGSGYYLKNKGTGRVMDDPAASRTEGTSLITWPLNSGKNQQWIVQ